MGRAYDVLVISSGPLGAAAARRLTDQGQHVLLIEQCPAISDPAGSHVRNAERFRNDPDSVLLMPKLGVPLDVEETEQIVLAV